jgi:hypothetical protein
MLEIRASQVDGRVIVVGFSHGMVNGMVFTSV